MSQVTFLVASCSAVLFIIVTIMVRPIKALDAYDVIVRDGSLTKGCCWPLHFTAHIGRAAGMPVGGAPGVLEVKKA